MYEVFVRSWWKPNPAWPNGLEPHASRGRIIRRNLSLKEARRFCAENNKHRKPDRYGMKAEFRSQ